MGIAVRLTELHVPEVVGCGKLALAMTCPPVPGSFEAAMLAGQERVHWAPPPAVTSVLALIESFKWNRSDVVRDATFAVLVTSVPEFTV